MRQLAIVFLCTGLLAMQASAATLTFVSNMSGSQETPPNGSTGSGQSAVTLDTLAHTLSVSVSFAGLTGGPASMAHIHCCAGPGVAAVVAVPFTSFPPAISGSYAHTFDLTAAATYNPAFLTSSGGTAALAESVLINGLNTGLTYTNIHNATFPAGEIRGQLAKVGNQLFSTGSPDGKMAMASRPGPGPGGGANQETEAADDFIFTAPLTFVNFATFTGLLPASVDLNTGIKQVVVEIYRVFPKDSVNPPSGRVPTRVNSPSDVEFDDRNSAVGTLSFSAALLNPSFTAANSVDNGIHPAPGQTTGGEGPVTGQEVQFNVTFRTPFLLPADHYFFVPQVLLADPNGHFTWLSAPRPITGGTGPFTPDLQVWIRNADLDPDWLRVGADIVGSDAFNATFSLTGTVPTTYEYDFFAKGTNTPATSFLFLGIVRDVSPASTPIPGFIGFIPPSPPSLVPCDLTSNSSAELDCRAPTVHSGIFYFVFDFGAFPSKLGPFTGSGFTAPDGATPSIGTVPLLNGQIIDVTPPPQ
jgi:hypothetical protein